MLSFLVYHYNQLFRLTFREALRRYSMPLLGLIVVVCGVAYYLFFDTRRRHGVGARAPATLTPAPAAAPGLVRSPTIPSETRRRVTCSTKQVFFRERAGVGDAAGPDAYALQGVSSLCLLSKACDLYLITQVADDKEEEQLRALLLDSGAVAAGLDPRKVLFCSTPAGRGSMVRQLAPTLHIDADVVPLRALLPHIPKLVLIGDRPGPSDLMNVPGVVTQFDSIDAFVRTAPQ
eukprot:gnl/Spiro4/9567_TR5074_c0_g1_i1.p2 gnl/Spiro4/9567_TR5074_c0_g1~~gnl/Spiro4/9567_TR5074_c0_g1_i1.p2  ORF type:complete len:233 (+),score=87.09 gnl/Spiro4/9567_TR5074_c0_g1_i1:53-751(+)